MVELAGQKKAGPRERMPQPMTFFKTASPCGIAYYGK
jgi:hypothetical protein